MATDVLLTRRLPSSVLSRLEAAVNLTVYDGPTPIPEDRLIASLAGKTGLVCVLTDRITERVLDASTSLRMISTVSVGFEHIDVAAAKARGIQVSNTPDVLTDAVAEHTWALILGVTRRLAEGD